MAEDEEQTASLESPLKIPVKRVIWCTVIFALWSAAISVVHAVIPERFDLTSVVVAEVGMLPVLLLMVRQLNLKWGDKSLGVIPAEVETTFKLERAFKETKTIVAEPRTDDSLPPPITGIGATSQRSQVAHGIVRVENPPDDSQVEDTSRRGMGDGAWASYVGDASVLVRLRAELEERLRSLAEVFCIPVNDRTNPQLLLAGLTGKGVIKSNEARGIIELLKLGNEQLHGLPLSTAAAEFARTEGEQLLEALNNLPGRVEAEIVWDIAERASSAGLKSTLTTQARGADILVGSDLAVEVKASGSHQNVTVAIMKTLHFMETQKIAKGLVVFGTPPIAEAMPSEESDRIGIAWRSARGHFGGTSTAKSIAPWMFESTKASS
jgi:hypothetical protein